MIRNYCIKSIIDDGYLLGERSVGALQLYNKTNEDKKIDRNDIARIEWLSKFVGALAVKAQLITSSLTLVIGMCESLPKTVGISQNPALGSAPGLGQFQQLEYALD